MDVAGEVGDRPDGGVAVGALLEGEEGLGVEIGQGLELGGVL